MTEMRKEKGIVDGAITFVCRPIMYSKSTFLKYCMHGRTIKTFILTHWHTRGRDREGGREEGEREERGREGGREGDREGGREERGREGGREEGDI